MTRATSLLIMLAGCVVGGTVGLVAYHWSQIQPDPLRENTAYFEKYEPSIAMAGKDIDAAIAAYKGTHGSFPVSLADLHLTNFSSGVSTSYLAYFEYSKPGGDAYLLSVRLGVVGLGLAHGDFRRVKSVRPDSPAFRANIEPGDYVLRVDGKDTSQLSYRGFLSAVQGPPGTSVTLMLRKEHLGRNVTVTLTREPDAPSPVSFKPR